MRNSRLNAVDAYRANEDFDLNEKKQYVDAIVVKLID
jgi:hypothetical protein